MSYAQTEKNNIAGKPFTLEIWALPDGKDGVLISHGGPQNGAGLILEQGKPTFVINSNSTRSRATATAPVLEGWHHFVGVLEADKTMKLYVDGQIVAQAKSEFIPAQPKQPLRLGGDGNNNLAGETLDASYTGMMDQFAIYTRALTGLEIQARLADPTAKTDKSLAQFSSFDKGDARDEAGTNHGVSGPGIETGKGRSGAALWFRRAPGAAPAVPAVAAGKGKGAKQAAKAATTTPSPTNPANPAQPGQPAPAQKGTFVQNDWQRYVPIITRAMAKAGNSLIVSGAEDLVDEEYAFERLAAKDKSILQQLQEQDDALEGKRGAKLWAVAVDNGNQSTGMDLASPPVWDGMAVAQGRLYVSSLDGVVRCFGKAK